MAIAKAFEIPRKDRMGKSATAKLAVSGFMCPYMTKNTNDVLSIPIALDSCRLMAIVLKEVFTSVLNK